MTSQEHEDLRKKVEDLARHKNGCSQLLQEGDYCSHSCNHDDNVIELQSLLLSAEKRGMDKVFKVADKHYEMTKFIYEVV